MKFLEKVLCVACSLAAVFVYAEDTTEGESLEKIISSVDVVILYSASGTDITDGPSFGGGTTKYNMFNGNFTENVYLPRAGANCYFHFDFSKSTVYSLPTEGWYITKVRVGNNKVNQLYSLYYSMDNLTWTPVPDAINYSKYGIAELGVNDFAKYFKVVIHNGTDWSPAINEIEISAIHPDDLECTHTSLSEWIPVEGSATCTKNGYDQQTCLICGEVFTRESSTILPNGHSFVTNLEKEGKVIAFGKGTINCTECDLVYDFPEPVNFYTLGGVKTEGVIQFLNFEVSSSGQAEHGTRPDYLRNNDWSMAWGAYWFSVGNTGEYIDYALAEELDLTSIEMSVANNGSIIQFYSVDGATETLINNFKLYKQKLELETVTGVNEDGTETTNVIVSSRTYEEEAEKITDGRLVIPYDEQIETISDGSNRYHKIYIEFFAQPVKTLRIRLCDNDEIYAEYEMTRPGDFRVGELVPYGTVKGAGKIPYELTTLILMK